MRSAFPPLLPGPGPVPGGLSRRLCRLRFFDLLQDLPPQALHKELHHLLVDRVQPVGSGGSAGSPVLRSTSVIMSIGKRSAAKPSAPRGGRGQVHSAVNGQQPGIGGDRRAAKLKHQPAVKIEPQRLANGFTRRVPH
jgi:hypothetical protein